MAFVLEKISKEDKEKYGFGISIDRWVVDKDRDIFLIHTGGSGMGEVSHFELKIKNHKVLMRVKEVIPPQSDKYDINFEIDSIWIPESIKNKKDVIINNISDSLKKFGKFGNPNKIGKVTVNFPDNSKIYFINPEDHKSKKGE